MSATNYQGSFLGRISIRRNQVASMDHEQELDNLGLFHKQVSERFSDLLSSSSDDSSSYPFLSIAWLRKLLDLFLCCEAQFKSILLTAHDPALISKPPLDRLLPEFLDRVVNALDICNAVMHGVESVRNYQNLAEIAVSALGQGPNISDGQVKRARKALNSMVNSMTLDDKEGTSANKFADRAWSFGRRGVGSLSTHKDRLSGQSNSSAWSMARGWSAAKQIHAMSLNLVSPRGAESNGLGLLVYIMNAVMVFVMWTLVAAIPCQERSGLGAHLQVGAKHMTWAQPMMGLQDKITEEWKKKEKRGSCGLLDEMQRMEKLGQSLIEFADGFEFPAEGEREEEVAAIVAELGENCRRMEEGLVPLQQQIREVFHRVVRSRTEVLDAFDRVGRVSVPFL